MSSIQDCLMKAMQRMTLESTMTGVKIHLLNHLCHKVSKVSDHRPPSSFSVADQWLLTAPELCILCRIAPAKEDQFLDIMGTWRLDSYHFMIAGTHYFSLLKLIQSEGFLDVIAPLTIYAMPSEEKDDR